MALYPPAHPAAEQVQITPQPWFLICAFVNDRVAAMPVPVAEVHGDLPPTPYAVHSWSTPGVIGAPLGV